MGALWKPAKSRNIQFVCQEKTPAAGLVEHCDNQYSSDMKIRTALQCRASDRISATLGNCMKGIQPQQAHTNINTSATLIIGWLKPRRYTCNQHIQGALGCITCLYPTAIQTLLYVAAGKYQKWYLCFDHGSVVIPETTDESIS